MTDNSKKLRLLIENAGITQKKAAEILLQETGDKIALTTIQRCIADPSISSARHCPGWVIKILGDSLKK